MHSTLKNILFLSTILLAFSCKTNGKSSAQSDNLQSSFESNKERSLQEEAKSKTKSTINYSYMKHPYTKAIKKLDSIYGYTPYIFKSDTFFFYYISDDKHSAIRKLMGLIDKNNTEILPMEYESIFSPDAISTGYMVIKKNGKYGLYDYVDHRILKPTFDIIYPADSPFIALAQLDNNLINISSDYSLDTLEFSDLDLTETFDNLSFPNKQIKPLYTPYIRSESIEVIQCFITPNYIKQYDILPLDMEFEEYDDEFGSKTIRVKNKSKVKEKYNIYCLKIKGYEQGMHMTGFLMSDSYNLVTVSKLGHVLSSVPVHYSDIGSDLNIYGEFLSSQFINDSTFQLSYVEDIQNDRIVYSRMKKYKFLKADKLGIIKTLNSNRLFNFTEYNTVDSSFFYGTYERYIRKEDNEDNANYWREIYEVTDHLSIEDLDIMINEIYADYGYIFKSEKWKSFFAKYPSYKARYDNVNDLLSERDRKNIDYILKYKKRIEQRISKLLNKREIEKHKTNAG